LVRGRNPRPVGLDPGCGQLEERFTRADRQGPTATRDDSLPGAESRTVAATRTGPVVSAKALSRARRLHRHPRRAGAEDNALQMKLCWCPAGSFTMGSPSGELYRESNEDQVPVTLSQGFWLGQCEVTQGSGGRSCPATQTPATFRLRASAVGRFKGWPPIVFRSSWSLWNDADEFCRKLTEQEHQAGRLLAGWNTGCRRKPNGNTVAGRARSRRPRLAIN